MSQTIATRLDDKTARLINLLTKEEHTDKSTVIRNILSKGVQKRLVELAVTKYKNNELSLGKAAELARVPIADFMAVLVRKKVTVNYSKSSFEADIKAATL